MSTYTPIATFTVSSATGGLSTPITFSSIPQGYTDLVIVINGKVTSGASMYLRFNGDAGNNYSWTYLRGTGSAAESGRDSNRELSTWSVWRTTNIQYGILQIQNYSNATTNKTYLSRSYDDNGFVYAYTSLWRNTSPITSIQFLCDTNYAVGTTFSLYGIQVGDKAQKAQGGNIVTSDGTYMYHAFTSSGSFVPNQALTADVLLVAGGGAGGVRQAGGGGAGGIFYATSQSLTAKSYTVTVGAGGAGSTNESIIGANGSDSQFGSLTLAKGGGGGGSNSTGTTVGSGGSGGGANNGYDMQVRSGGSSTQTGTGGTGYGNAGGSSASNCPGGGGGAGAAGANGASAGANIAGSGGIGLNTWSSWATATSTGVSGYYAGGGGGGAGGGQTAGTGGAGGGGTGGANGAVGNTGIANTGGGGGSSGGGSAILAGSGGSGIVIIRYAI